MTQKTPEEYFRQLNFGADEGGGFTPAERAFMQKYLGLDDTDVLGKIGITPPPATPAVMPVEAPPEVPAGIPAETPALAGQPAETTPETMPEPASPAAEAEVAASAGAEEETPPEPVAGQATEEVLPAAISEEPTTDIPEEPNTPEPAPEVEAAAPVAPEPTAPSAPEPGPVPTPAPAPAAAETASPPASVPAAGLKPSQIFEPEVPSLESVMREAVDLQLVAFFLANQEFVLPIMAVQEVIKAVPFAKLPAAPPVIAGVINLRGRVTPLIQLRDLLGVARAAENADSFIVICRRKGIQMGLIIDRVHTMYRVSQADVDWQVEAHLGNVDYISGLFKANNRLFGIVSVDKIFDMLLEV